MPSAWHWPQQCRNMYISSWLIWECVLFVKFFYIELHNYVNSKPLAEQHYEEYVELAAVIFFVPPSPPFEFFLLRGAGGQHHFPQIEKKITLLLILQFLMKNLLKTIKNKQRYIITGEVKLRFVMRNRLKRGWYAQQFTYLQRNNFLYFSCKKLSSNWKLEKKMVIFRRGNHLILVVHVFRP